MKPWTFVHVADIQPGSPRSFRYNPSWIRNWHEAKAQILAINPDLLLVGGDLTRDGRLHRYELDAMRAELDAFPFPVHVIPGNMDTGNKHTDRDGRHRGPGQCTDRQLNVTSANLQQFASVFGPLWWSVVHKQVRFSGFADVVVNSGLPEEEAFWRWAEALKAECEILRPPAQRPQNNTAAPGSCHSERSEESRSFGYAQDDISFDPQRQRPQDNTAAPGSCHSERSEESRSFGPQRQRPQDDSVARVKYHVWIMHYPLFVDAPDEPNWDIEDPAHYRDWYFSIDQPGRARLLALFKATGANVVISGHVHCHHIVDVDDIRFEIAPATSFAQWPDRWPDGDPTLGFLEYTVTDEGLVSTFVPLRRTYDLEGYGPGGHPAPEVRDYGVAWEK